MQRKLIFLLGVMLSVGLALGCDEYHPGNVCEISGEFRGRAFQLRLSRQSLVQKKTETDDDYESHSCCPFL